MQLRFTSLVFGLVLIAAATADAARAGDCDGFDVTMVQGQNAYAMEKYENAHKRFDAQFSAALPKIKAHGAELYSKWRAFAQASFPLFESSTQKLIDEMQATGVQRPNAGHYITREVEDGLNRKFPRSNIDVKLVVKMLTNEDGTPGPQGFALDENGNPIFEICFDDPRPEAVTGVSFACGVVTRDPQSLPDQQKFVDGFVDLSKRSLMINGEPDLQKPMLALAPNGCPSLKPKPPAAKKPEGVKVAEDASSVKPVVATVEAGAAVSKSIGGAGKGIESSSKQ